MKRIKSWWGPLGLAMVFFVFSLWGGGCGDSGGGSESNENNNTNNSNVNENLNTNQNQNENSNTNSNNNEPEPTGSSPCGHWVEGTMEDDDGATRDFYNRGARLAWRNYLGDWHDADGVAQGETPFAMTSVADDGEPGYEEWEVTSLVQGWVNGTYTVKGFYLKRVGGSGTFNFYSREHGVEGEIPELVLSVDGVESTLTPEADTYLAPSTYQGFGDDVELSISDERPVLLRFDLSSFDATAVIESATLRLFCYEDYGGGALEVGVFRSSQGMELPPDDPELGVAALYPGDTGISEDPAVLLATNFESADWGLNWTQGTDNPNLELISTDPGDGFSPLSGNALRVTVAADEHYGASFAYKFAEEIGEEPLEIYFRYYLRISEDWMPTDTGKLPGISGTYGVAGWGGRPSDGTNGWSARGTYRMPIPSGNNPFADHSVIGNYVYHADMEGTYGDVFLWTSNCGGVLERSRWYSVEQYLKMNTPGEPDGIIRAWIDGRLAHEKNDLRFRTVDTLKIEQVWMDFYHGGGGVPTSDIHLYIDNVVIATEYIGPIAE